MREQTLDKIVGISKGALSVWQLFELQEVAKEIWGYVPNLRKPELVKKIWDSVNSL